MVLCVELVSPCHTSQRMIHIGKEYQAEVEDYCTGEWGDTSDGDVGDHTPFMIHLLLEEDLTTPQYIVVL